MRPAPVGVARTRDLSHLRSASLFWKGSGPHPSPAASAVGFIAGRSTRGSKAGRRLALRRQHCGTPAAG